MEVRGVLVLEVRGVLVLEVRSVLVLEVRGVLVLEVNCQTEFGVSVRLRYPHPCCWKTCRVLLTFLGAAAKCNRSCEHVPYGLSADMSV